MLCLVCESGIVKFNPCAPKEVHAYSLRFWPFYFKCHINRSLPTWAQCNYLLESLSSKWVSSSDLQMEADHCITICCKEQALGLELLWLQIGWCCWGSSRFPVGFLVLVLQSCSKLSLLLLEKVGRAARWSCSVLFLSFLNSCLPAVEMFVVTGIRRTSCSGCETGHAAGNVSTWGIFQITGKILSSVAEKLLVTSRFTPNELS